MFFVQKATTAEELTSIIQLRYEVLRKPWQQSITTASDELEDVSVNAFLKNNNGNTIACGRLQENENKIGQIRYMAVSKSSRGSGLGKKILLFLEEKAAEKNIIKIELQARENAVDFYRSCGYTVKEKSFLLWGIIQHYLMERTL